MVAVTPGYERRRTRLRVAFEALSAVEVDALSAVLAERLPDAVVELGLAVTSDDAVTVQPLVGEPEQCPAVAVLEHDDAVGAMAALIDHRVAVSWSSSEADLTCAVVAAARGEAWLAPDLGRHLLSLRSRGATDRGRLTRLTDRQREVVALLGDGLDRRAVARALGIAVSTVNTHLGRAYDVLQVHSQVELAVLGMWAARENAIPPMAQEVLRTLVRDERPAVRTPRR